METRGIPSRIKELTTELEYNFIDPLLATWNEGDIRAFFLKVLHHDGIRMPVLLISHLAGKFNLPRKESGQAIVLDFMVNI